MEKFQKVIKPKELNLFSIEPDENGKKQIHISGYTYKGDDHWEVVGICFFIEPLAEFIQHVKENEYYVGEESDNYKQYFYDCDANECKDSINEYFDGNPADYILSFTEITMDTPCGNYVN